MATTTDTRTATIHANGDIRINGLTRGPAVGWSFDGTAFVHCGGGNLPLTPAAASRVAAAATLAVAPRSERATGAQLAKLPEHQREGFEFAYVQDGAIGIYIRYTPGSPVEVVFDRSDIAR